MCGIAGFITRNGLAETELIARVSSMADAIRHRGPDGSGVWTEAESGLAFGHRRLAINDLSPTGTQPMQSADGNWVLCFNGEIYNFRQLRTELEATGSRFRGTSDSEVLVEAVATWGPRTALSRSVGMFAIALWHRPSRTLVLARDRMGKKPLYYADLPDGFLFGSELKALRAWPGFPQDIDTSAIPAYLALNCVPAPLTIFRAAKKLRPGTMLTLKAGQAAEIEDWWDIRTVAVSEAGRHDSLTEEVALQTLTGLLDDAVGLRMIADVPVGAFLSGGVDSSLVTALMQKQSTRPVKTFTIGFAEASHDEMPYARAVAKHLGTEHHEMVLEARAALDLIPRLPVIWDEPFADSSQLPTFLVSQLTRSEVTVALTGDGGDEVFAGYSYYEVAARHMARLAATPPFARTAAQALGRFLLERHDPSRPQLRGIRKNLRRLIARNMAASQHEVFCEVISGMGPFDGLSPLGRYRPDPQEMGGVDLQNPIAFCQVADMGFYLPNDILTKVDRGSMAVALETRMPLLDHRVVEFASGLPPHLRVDRGNRKLLLKRLLARHVPSELFERPKQGFSIPLNEWLRGPLRDWAEALLAPAELDRHGLVDGRAVQRLWRDHLSGRVDRQKPLWAILMLQTWLKSH